MMLVRKLRLYTTYGDTGAVYPIFKQNKKTNTKKEYPPHTKILFFNYFISTTQNSIIIFM